MSIIVSDSGGGGNFKLPEPGMHQAVCSKVFDLGQQPGFSQKLQHKLVIYWELEETIDEGEYAGKPMVIMKTYTASLNEKANLRHDLVSWRGRDFTEAELKGFDIESVVGVGCTLNVIHADSNGKVRARIVGVMPRQKNAPEMKPTLGDDFMPGWIAELIGDNKTAQESTFEDDSIPF